MNTTPDNSLHPTAADDAQREEIEERFMLAYRRGETLKDWMTRYPQHAQALADLSLAMDAQRLLPEPSPEETAAARRSIAAALEELPLEAVPAPGLLARAKALKLTIPELAKRLQLTPDLLVKLDQGYIQLDTVPRRFLAHVAQALQTTVESLAAGLRPAPTMAGGMAFYTKDKPQSAQQQSFVQALHQARGLGPAVREQWETAAREEGKAE